jgi:hypothetical protein
MRWEGETINKGEGGESSTLRIVPSCKLLRRNPINQRPAISHHTPHTYSMSVLRWGMFVSWCVFMDYSDVSKDAGGMYNFPDIRPFSQWCWCS